MEKKIAGLLGAVAALGALSTAQAAPTPAPGDALKANSFAELLEPIPNAAALLRAVDASRPTPPADGNVQLAQFYHHHHHHHHHSFYPRYGYGPGYGYGEGIVVAPGYRRYYRHHHHHHHHHHHSFYRRDY